MVVAGAERWVKWGDVSQRVQTFIHNTNKFQGSSELHESENESRSVVYHSL